MNAGESDVANKIERADIEEADDIKKRYRKESYGEEAASRICTTPKLPQIKGL